MSDTLPDARQDLAGAVNFLINLVDELRRGRDEERIDAAQASRLLGYKDKQYCSRFPWRVPGFGLHGRMHSLRAWREWIDRPEAQRRSEWDKMSLKERRLAQGIAS
jgi:hypothetical protein